jgi:hypothetical protein
MSSLGIYFGANIIKIAETRGKKILNDVTIPTVKINTAELEEKIPDQIKIVAFFKDELRRNKITARDANLALSGKDLIVRTFEIPQLPADELASAINFEAKKYMPFKLEEMILDYQVIFDKAGRKNMVLLVGIKKEVMDKYASIFSQLNIAISSIEYGAFSILRLLKLARYSDKGIIGVIGADLQGEDEANFVVLENGFPLFSRDIALAAGPGEAPGAKDLETGMLLEKLKTEIRISLDYYHRKFPTKNIQKVFFASARDCSAELEVFIKDLGLTAQFLDVAKLIDKSVAFSLAFLKSYTASLSRAVKTNLKINLLAPKTQRRPVKEAAFSLDLGALLAGLKINPRVIILAVLICVAPYIYGQFNRMPLKKELDAIIAMRPQLSSVSPGSTYEDLAGIEAKYQKRIATLDRLVKKRLYFTPPLDAIPKMMPKGVWLQNFSFRKTSDQKIELSLDGLAYLADSDREFDVVNSFLSGLKADRVFSSYFKEINLSSLDTTQLEKTTLTRFIINCRTESKEKERE